jgi:hypothetical protein
MSETTNAEQKELMDLLAKHSVPEALQKAVEKAGYNSVGVFAKIFSTEEKLDRWLTKVITKDKVLGDVEEVDVEFLPAVGFMRVVRDMAAVAWESATAAASKTKSAVVQSDGANGGDSDLCTQLVLAKLAETSKRVGRLERVNLETSFLAKYPGQVLCDSTRPGSTLLWALKRMKDPDVGFTWVSWGAYKSVQDESEAPLEAAKTAKALASLGFGGENLFGLWNGKEETPPSVQEFSDGGAFKVQSVLTLRAVGMAMLDMCGLAAGMCYVTKFMNLYRARYNGIGMRSPNLKEAMEADRLALTAAFDVANRKGASLDDAVKAVASDMGELSVYMGPKPGTAQGTGVKGDRKRKAEEAGVEQRKSKETCREWKQGRCKRGQRCRYAHQ